MNVQELITDFGYNLRTLAIEPITIATVDGPKQSDALILGDWALNENSAGWTVTHRKSGYAGKSYPTPIEALISLGIYLGAGIPNEFPVDGFRDIPGIHDIAARIKVGLATLDGWDLDIDYNEPEYSQDA